MKSPGKLSPRKGPATQQKRAFQKKLASPGKKNAGCAKAQVIFTVLNAEAPAVTFAMNARGQAREIHAVNVEGKVSRTAGNVKGQACIKAMNAKAVPVIV